MPLKIWRPNRLCTRPHIALDLPMAELFFVYGTLRDPELRAAVLA